MNIRVELSLILYVPLSHSMIIHKQYADMAALDLVTHSHTSNTVYSLVKLVQK